KAIEIIPASTSTSAPAIAVANTGNEGAGCCCAVTGAAVTAGAGAAGGEVDCSFADNLSAAGLGPGAKRELTPDGSGQREAIRDWVASAPGNRPPLVPVA